MDARIVKAERYLNTAQLALERGDLDSCASRAYYAVFHACIALLSARGRTKRIEKASYQMVFSDFVNLTTKRNKWFVNLKDMAGSKDLHSSLHHLVSVREDGDYGIDIVTQNAAKQELQFAKALVEAVNERIP